MSTAVEGKAMEDIKKQLASLQTTVQSLQATVKDQQAKIKDQQAKIEELKKERNSSKNNGKNYISDILLDIQS